MRCGRSPSRTRVGSGAYLDVDPSVKKAKAALLVGGHRAGQLEAERLIRPEQQPLGTLVDRVHALQRRQQRRKL